MRVTRIRAALVVGCTIFSVGAVERAAAFPSWMGVYGSYQRHDGGNPGTFTVLMNQDYYGLHAEVAVQVNGGGWTTYEMNYAGNVDGNSLWQFTPSWTFPATQIVDFYFHGWDDWGGNIWDNNGGANYWFTAGHNGIVQWIGNTWHYPFSGEIDEGEDFWVNIESWPAGAAKEGRVVYSINQGFTWSSVPLAYNGQAGNNDAWHGNLGPFGAATTIRYAIEITEWAGGVHWDNNGGSDFFAQVNFDPAADEDGDGIPNGWENANGFEPTNPHDAVRDADADELTNIREYLAGTDPYTADSDGDGLTDAIEVIGTSTDPLSAETHTITDADSLYGADGTNTTGAWSVDATELKADGTRGSVEYTLTVSQGDVYRLEILGTHDGWISNVTHAAQIDVEINDEFVKRLSLSTFNGADTPARCFTPYLAAGQHSLRLDWDNAAAYNRLRISAIKLQTIAGPDSDANGLKDWVENWLTARNGVEVAPAVSKVSPAFVEGRAAFPSLVTSPGGATVRQGAGRSWYLNAALTQGASLQVDLAYEGAILQESISIEWEPLNVIVDGDITIRKDDSLLLTAFPLPQAAGTVTIDIPGVTNYVTTDDMPVAHQFSDAGAYTVIGTHDDGVTVTSTSITVTVVSASFGGSPAVWVDKVRDWDCPGIGEEIAIEPHPEIRIADKGPLAGGGRIYGLSSTSPGARYVLARLGDNGPVLAREAVRGVDLSSSSETYVKVMETYSDGSKLLEMGVVTSPIESDVDIQLDIFAAGVTFDDGTIFKVLTASDFDALGETSVRFIKAAGVQASVCHWFRAYQGQDFLGQR